MSIQADLPNGGRRETPIYDGLREEWPAIWAKHEVDKVLQERDDREAGDNDGTGSGDDGAQGAAGSRPSDGEGVPGDGSTDGVDRKSEHVEPGAAPGPGDALDG